MRIVIQNNTVQYVVPGPWLFQTWWNMLSKKSTKKKGMNEWMNVSESFLSIAVKNKSNHLLFEEQNCK